MSLSGIWATLGIAQTRDRAEIRRAYAARLKLVHPEDDPAGFQALRAAYDRALAQADRVARAPARAAPVTAEPVAEAPVEPPAATEIPPPEPTAEPKAAEIPAPPESVAEREKVAPPPLSAPIAPESPPPLEPAPEPEAVAPPPPPPPPPVAPPPPPSDVNRHQMACTRLSRIVSRQMEVDPALLAGLLDEVLDGAAMEQIGVFIRTEAMVAHLIAANVPRSDPLVAPAITRFGWVVDGRARDTDPSIAAVLARQVDLKYLAGLRNPNNPLRKAAAMLRAPPVKGEALRGLVQFGRLNDLRILLDNLRRDHPGLLSNFPPGVVDAWTAYLDQPHIASGAFWGAIGMALAVAFITTTSSVPPPPGGDSSDLQPHWSFFLAWPAWTAAALGVLAAKLFAYDQPRHRWRSEWAERAPDWVTWGWAPAAVAILALSVILPLVVQAMVPWWTWIAFAALCVPVVLWAAITGERPAPLGDNWPWPLRHLARGGLLLIMWAVLLLKPPILGAEPQVATAVAACAMVSGLGEQTLADAWRRRLGRRGRIAAVALMLAAGVALMVLLASSGEKLIPFPLAAAVSLLALLHRLPGSTGKPFVLPRMNLGSNPLLALWSLLVLLAIGAAVLSIVVAVAAVLGPWLVLGGAMVGLVRALDREIKSARSTPA